MVIRGDTQPKMVMRMMIRKGGAELKTMAAAMLLAIVLVLGVAVLAGCESPEAQRTNAEARLVQAEADRERAQAEAEALRLKAEGEARAAEERAKAEADVERQRARAEAEASLAATRQMERDAAHQRMVESLIALSLVALPLSLVAGAVIVLLTRRRRSLDPMLLVYLDRLQLRQAMHERELWHAVARMQRQALAAGDHRAVRVIDVSSNREPEQWR